MPSMPDSMIYLSHYHKKLRKFAFFFFSFLLSTQEGGILQYIMYQGCPTFLGLNSAQDPDFWDEI